MRIAQVMLGKGFGGAERSFVDLSRCLAARGHEVLAIGDPRGPALAMLESTDNIRCEACRCFGSWDRVAEARIRRAARRFRADLVHAHLARAAHLAGHAAHQLRLPAIAKTHNLVNPKYYRDIDCLVPTTRAQERYLLGRGVAHSRIERIPNFTTVDPVSAVPTPKAPPRIVSAGRLVAKKGFDVLLAACAILRREGEIFELEIAGDGPERDALSAELARLELSDVAKLTGWRDDIPGFIDGARIFALPSHDEPFGIVLLEAMARGIPIVATRTQGPTEILNESSAELVDAGDAQALAGAIRSLLDPAHAMALAQSALDALTANYTATVVVDRYEACYKKLIQGATA